MLVFDLETDGLENYTKIHTLSLYDTEKDVYETYDKQDVPNGIKRLEEADCICGHNIINFDLPAIKGLFPGFKMPPKIIDTLVWSRLEYPDIIQVDLFNHKKWEMPSALIGKHSLEAWGYRLGEFKGDYGKTHDWSEWSQEMSDYCRQDVVVTVKLLRKLQSKKTSEKALELEHQVAFIIQRQVKHGFLFDIEKAQKLYVELSAKKEELEQKLAITFPPFINKEIFIPKVNNKKRGYVKGVPFTKVKEIPFNPGSRQHIERALREKYNWKPKEFTPSGQAKVDESILKVLPYPEAQLLAEYFMIQKRLGQLADGDKGWLRLVKPDGRIHGEVITNGAVTGRMTHNNPNIAQVPAVGVPYGYECREVFTVPKGYWLVGCDAAALELRCLAHFMAPYDGGAYAKAVIHGKKEEGTDIHTLNMKALGITSRDVAKTWFYAYIYGAGNYKLGSLLTPLGTLDKKIVAAGKRSREQFEKNLPALGTLQKKVKAVVVKRGYLIGLDGRRLRVRSEHSALNTLLQSAGAVVMKKGLILLDKALSEQYKGLYEFTANIHDEWQIEVKGDKVLAEEIGKRAVRAIQAAGEYFKFRCQLDGEYSIGKNWAETH